MLGLGVLDAVVALLGRSWNALGAALGRLGALLGRFWPVLGRSWDVLGRSWGPLGRCLGYPPLSVCNVGSGFALLCYSFFLNAFVCLLFAILCFALLRCAF